jgi:HSP20 family molecular chaperone IbpA
MPNSPVRERDSSPLRSRLAAVAWPVPSTAPDTSEVDSYWFDAPRHSFIALKGARHTRGALNRQSPPALPLPTQELAYDLCDSPHALVILVDLPGVLAGDISLTLGSQALYLKASVKLTDEPRAGLAAGSYELRVEAPQHLGPDTIDASLRHGVLRVRIAKSPGSARRVTIVADDAQQESPKSTTMP